MGGGGDDGYSARQAETEQRKQEARDRLNVSFGVSPSELVAHPRQNGRSEFLPSKMRDQIKAAREAEFQAMSASAERNKSARDALYGTVRQNAFDAGRRGLDEDREDAARDMKFALFANGLNGGSVDVDENAKLGRVYSQGVLDLGAQADAAKTDLMSNDEQTRLGLLQSIDAGMDQGSALSSALNQMRINSDRAASQAQGTSLGNLFGDAGLLYSKTNAARGRQSGMDAYERIYGSAQPRRNSGANGIVTQTY